VLLAWTSGWVRVVFNDALRARQDAHGVGERVSDSQVQPKVVTLARTNPAAWVAR
jgi:putative transposase